VLITAALANRGIDWLIVEYVEVKAIVLTPRAVNADAYKPPGGEQEVQAAAVV